MSAINFLSYLNPFSNYHAIERCFDQNQDISTLKKVAICAASVFSGFFTFGLGGIVAFRVLTDWFSKYTSIVMQNGIKKTFHIQSNPIPEKFRDLVLAYKQLKNTLNPTGQLVCLADELCLIDEKGTQYRERLSKFLGSGGSKAAIELSKGRVLIVPNMSVDPINHIAYRWGRVVDEEVAASDVLKEIGLLSPESQKVHILLEENGDKRRVPAYICKNFESLPKEKGWFVIDRNNRGSDLWRKSRNFLFSSEEARLNEKNWDSIFAPLLKDIAKIIAYDLPVGGDSLNLVVMKKPSQSAVCQYEVRYFGFDFSSKAYPCEFFARTRSDFIKKFDIDEAKYLLSNSLDHILCQEANEMFYWPFNDKRLNVLRQALLNKYIPIIKKEYHLLTKEIQG